MDFIPSNIVCSAYSAYTSKNNLPGKGKPVLPNIPDCQLPGLPFIPQPAGGNIISTPPQYCLSVLINVGALFFIDITLYSISVSTGISVSCCFLRYKTVSSSILFLSEDGNETHTPPSSASYHLSIARL